MTHTPGDRILAMQTNTEAEPAPETQLKFGVYLPTCTEEVVLRVKMSIFL